ncbi:MAG TPA: GNAT family N-acetyltransferase [Chitinophagaceae bacterium]
MASQFIIRPIRLEDAKYTYEIYRPYVEDNITSFEYVMPSPEEWEARIGSITAEYPYVVCEHNNEVIGYAYGTRHRYRTAYSWSVESAIYVSEKFHSSGVARILYETLFALLKLQGYVNVYAGVGMPNDKSEKFHRSMGFYDVGVFKKIGYKFGGWHDTKWFQMHLIDHPAESPTLKMPAEIENTAAYKQIFEDANQKMEQIISQRKPT